MRTITVEWPMDAVDAKGVDTEVIYEVTCNLTPGEATVIRMDPDDSYEGSAPECEIESIKLQGLGKQPGIDLAPILWPLLGFTNKVIEQIGEKAFEEAGADDRDYYDERD